MKIRVRGEVHVIPFNNPSSEIEAARERQFSGDLKDSSNPRRPPTPAEINKKNRAFWEGPPAA